MQDRGFIQYIVIIAVILAVIFLSQQPFMRPFGVFAYNWSVETADVYWAKGANWFWAGLHPAVEKEIVEKGGTLQEEAIEQKDNAVKSFWGKIKNYFAKKFSGATGTKVE